MLSGCCSPPVLFKSSSPVKNRGLRAFASMGFKMNDSAYFPLFHNFTPHLLSFCDENGTINTEMTGSTWKSEFAEKGNKTVVSTELRFESADQLEQMIQMGFKEGFEMGLGNLDQLLPELK